MSFPESTRVVYEITPLKEVICQVRFPPILAIGATDPADFQERIRSTYPYYDRVEEVPPEVAVLAKQLGIKPQKSDDVHVFKTEDDNRSIHLANDRLSIIDSSYKRWEPFHNLITEAISALEAVYKPAFYLRIGLRYINLVSREELDLSDVNWSELINPRLAGIFADTDIGHDVSEASSHVLISVKDGDHVRLRHGLARPTDVAIFGYLIDADFFTTQKEGGSGAHGKLALFNRIAGQLFRWAINDRLHQALKPTTV